MEIEILGQGAFSSALVRLAAGESFVSESGAMYRASSNIEIDVTTRSRGRGGILAGVKRLLAGDNFFFSSYTLSSGQFGQVGLAPTLQGEVRIVDVGPDIAWLCAGGSYMGSAVGLTIDTQFQGLRGMFGTGSLDARLL